MVSRASNRSSERRKLQRLSSKQSFVTSTAGEFDLLNVCPTGIGVRGPAVKALAPGQQHLFVVTDRGQTFEVAGEVKWKSTDSDNQSQALAGVAFTEVFHAERRGLWAGVCRDYSS